MAGAHKLVLIGGGGHCKSVLDTVIRSNMFSEIVITDFNVPAGERILGCRVAGNDKLLPDLYSQGFLYAFITVGSIKSTSRRREIYRRAKETGFLFPAIVDPSAIVAGSAKIGQGVFIGKNSVVNTEAAIQDMAIINTGAIVEHECHVGEFTHIAVGAVLCGNVDVGDDSFIGANATVTEGIKLGSRVIVGAGSVVRQPLPTGCMAAGAPARIIKNL